MMNKIVLLVIVGIVGVLLMPSQVDAYGAAHVGYTHVGPNGAYHTAQPRRPVPTGRPTAVTPAPTGPAVEPTTRGTAARTVAAGPPAATTTTTTTPAAAGRLRPAFTTARPFGSGAEAVPQAPLPGIPGRGEGVAQGEPIRAMSST